MAVKKSVAKQYLKYILQKTVLPLCYKIGCRKAVDNRLVLFADSNSDCPPESMSSLIIELTNRGYRCEIHCCNFSKAGFFGMMKFMCRFMTRYAQTGTLVICNYFVPAHACNKRSETKVIQLWHSCGALKKFGYSTDNDISKHFKGSVSKNIDLVTVSAPVCEGVFKEAFDLPKGVARALGVCRTDAFFDLNFKKACREKLLAEYPKLAGKRLVLYLPTFRGDASNARCVGQEAVIGLKKRLDSDVYLIVRMHPRIKNGQNDLQKLSTNELLVCADLLITDYSSVIFEYALTKREAVLWCPDLEEYTAERDFYLDFRRDMPYSVVTDENELEKAVTEGLKGGTNKKIDKFIAKYMSACDGNATKRTADFIEGKE